ncbi:MULTISPECIES: HVO_2523 family zinc finger protein [Natrialbaceae]|uniref:HVO_2523 family zinc finger protein n=1 Tax=Natrialbaceae TaxID=1644061 RepID=UPI00207CE78D|nr:HVO_2523 family zinc finger protein [Natronococcus sp. CG52]
MTGDGDAGSDGDGGSQGRSDQPSGAPTCPHCRAPMYKRHCKYVCPQHGVVIDCSDPFR